MRNPAAYLSACLAPFAALGLAYAFAPDHHPAPAPEPVASYALDRFDLNDGNVYTADTGLTLDDCNEADRLSSIGADQTGELVFYRCRLEY